ncbi:MAG: sigma-70 family RNA polymerase sigma factor [Clostridiaceae bacterium]
MEPLIQRAQKGDSESFIEAINLIVPQLYKTARTRLSSEEDIGDAIQETIISAFANIGKLKKTEYFKTWAVRILINKCNDIIKKNNKVVYLAEIDESAELYGFGDDASVDRMDLENAINHLPEDYKTSLILYYVNRFTTKEMAEILDESEGTIKSRLSRARNILKNCLLNYGGVKCNE